MNCLLPRPKALSKDVEEPEGKEEVGVEEKHAMTDDMKRPV